MVKPEFPITKYWLLPLLITALFLFAVHVAYLLSIRAGYVPACVPYFEGCVSISRAARHGPGNVLFKLVVIPCALLHAWVWWLSARWLEHRGGRSTALFGLRALGVSSAIALGVYAMFLGSQGEIYGFLRRYGITVYFGFGYIAQLLLLRVAARCQAISPRLLRIMLAVCAGMLLLGVGNVIATASVADAALQDRIENALEWQLGLLLVGWFALLGFAWRNASR